MKVAGELDLYKQEVENLRSTYTSRPHCPMKTSIISNPNAEIRLKLTEFICKGGCQLRWKLIHSSCPFPFVGNGAGRQKTHVENKMCFPSEI